ncbi:hypothetical protein CBR_g8280 [Chara braunii]|uniref:Uncharacterized protein n=1 Tax=Chara braunii TaxID=69332 RepID=A0A388KLQ8_CHABU|nr:hypothetical protein CBR_g8280 [Chara braunii]|eukprot:GBG70980.1 hypothetical protein CBR_g8280 [Chara braunii]
MSIATRKDMNRRESFSGSPPVALPSRKDSFTGSSPLESRSQLSSDGLALFDAMLHGWEIVGFSLPREKFPLSISGLFNDIFVINAYRGTLTPAKMCLIELPNFHSLAEALSRVSHSADQTLEEFRQYIKQRAIFVRRIRDQYDADLHVVHHYEFERVAIEYPLFVPFFSAATSNLHDQPLTELSEVQYDQVVNEMHHHAKRNHTCFKAAFFCFAFSWYDASKDPKSFKQAIFPDMLGKQVFRRDFSREMVTQLLVYLRGKVIVFKQSLPDDEMMFRHYAAKGISTWFYRLEKAVEENLRSRG